MRDDAILTNAIEAFESGRHADALVAVEYVCRRYPNKSIPAILRAKILQVCRPELSAKAWYRAWCCDPQNPALQDVMLHAWFSSGATSSVAELGPAFLPERCRTGQHGSLVKLLVKAGLTMTGACWKVGNFIEGMIFDLAPTSDGVRRVRLLASDAHGQFPYHIAADGKRFRIACPRPQGVWSLSIVADGAGAAPRLLQGSPIVFEHGVAAPTPGAAAPAGQQRPPVAVIIPVYRERALVQACINSVLASLQHNRTPAQLVVIDDASPEPDLSAWLDQLAAEKRITLLRNRDNLGFIETVNRGLRLCPAHDALLLNADTLVQGDWIDRLATALYSAPDIASVTPWSNNGEISSFPKMTVATPAPSAAQLAAIDSAAARARLADVDIPSCCGFTMLMRRSVLNAIGVLDGVGLVRGYGEEVDWCLRAAAAGHRHLLATGVFVAHTGTVSFRFEKTLRVQQNRIVLASRYPHYHPQYRAFIKDDPLGAARTALRDALEQAGSDWLAASERLLDSNTEFARALPAALPSKYQRIAIWQHRLGEPGADKVLLLARLIARLGPACPLRLLIVGDASEALWHTGVVDVVPSLVWQESTLLNDAALVGLGGCTALLSASGAATPIGLTHVCLDAQFDPQTWLTTFLAPAGKKTKTRKVTAAA